MFSGLIEPVPEPVSPQPGRGESPWGGKLHPVWGSRWHVGGSLLRAPLSGAAALSWAQGQGLLTFDTFGGWWLFPALINSWWPEERLLWRPWVGGSRREASPGRLRKWTLWLSRCTFLWKLQTDALGLGEKAAVGSFHTVWS